MNAQQKKNGWFFNKNIIDEINSIPEDEIMIEQRTSEVTEKNIKNQNIGIDELNQKISEKDELIEQIKREASLEKQRLMKENEKYKQAILRTGEEKAENRRQIQDLELEVRSYHQKLEHLQEDNETGYLKEQLDVSKEKITSLEASLKDVKELENELQNAKQQIQELTLSKEESDYHHQERVQKLEKKLEDFENALKEKVEQINQLDQLIADKDQEILEKEMLAQQLIEENKQQNSDIESEQLLALQSQIESLKSENEQLRQDAIYSQHEIGEVLISARRQANRMVEKAKMDAQRIVKDSETELQTIYDQAKEISCEVDESRQTIMSIYEELKKRVDQLASSKVPELREMNERYESPKFSIMSNKDPS